MSYSSDEIKAEVSQVVQGRSTFSSDGLGGRNIKERFDDTRELVNSVLLYEPDSVFYLIYKAVIKARILLTSVLSTMDDLSEDLDGMAVPSRPVEDTTALNDAGTALSVISTALSRRGSISSAEYQRYERAMDRALNTYKQATKRTYTPFSGSQATTDVVKGSAEAVISLRSNFATFSTSYATLLATVDRLLGSFNDYDHDNIVRSVALRQVSRIQSKLSEAATSFDERTPTQRSATARTDTLSIITNKASVRALSRVRYPGEPKLQQTSAGAPLYRASAHGEGTAPTILGTVGAPWAVTNSHGLQIDFGGSIVTVPLVPQASSVQGIKAASMTGCNAESAVSFAINEALDTPWPLLTKEVTGNYSVSGTYLYLVVDGTMFKISDDTGSSPPTNPFSGDRSASQLAGDINFHAGSHVTATEESGGGFTWVKIAYKPPASPPAMFGNRYIQAASGPDNATTFDGTWRVLVNATPQSGSLSSGWDGNDELWIWTNALTEANAIKVDLPNGTWPSYVVSASTVASAIDAASAELSAAANAEGKIVLTSANEGDGSILKIVSEGLDGDSRSYPSKLGAETLGFYVGQEVRESGFRAQALVDVLNVDSSFAAKARAELVKADLLTEKRASASSPNQVDIVTSDTTSEWVAAEVRVNIEAGENKGVYGLSSFSYAAGTLSLFLDRNLREPTATGFRVRVYEERLRITALDAGTSSYIDVDELYVNTAHGVLGLPEALTRGSVSQLYVEYNDPAKGWIAANLGGLGIKVGDVICTEDATLIAAVVGVGSLSSGILDISPVDPTLSLSEFRIESLASDNHSSFLTSLQEWRDDVTTDEETLGSLNKSLNILMKIENPDRSRVQAAANQLQTIRDILEGSAALSGIFESFTIAAIPAVDRALEVLREQGHDRARELLTNAQFSDYSQTNYKTCSTSGAMMDAASKVAVADLVEPTKTQPEFVGQIDKHVFTTWDEIDPKYDFSDIEPDEAPIHLDYFAADIPRR